MIRVDLIIDNGSSKNKNGNGAGAGAALVQQPVRDNEKLEALSLLLYGMGKGFVADTI